MITATRFLTIGSLIFAASAASAVETSATNAVYWTKQVHPASPTAGQIIDNDEAEAGLYLISGDN